MIDRPVHISSSLIADLRNGSEQAFRDIFDLLGKKVFHYCLKMVDNHEDAEELLQDVFLKIWKFREHIDPSANFEVFLFTVARNHLLNFARKRAGNAVLLADHMAVIEDHQAISYKETYRQYREVLEKLGPKSRQVFELSREQGLSNKEIAQKLGISIRTVETHVSNVLAVLRSELKDTYFLLFILFILS